MRRQSIEPQFVSAAYFLKFPFDPGQYALAGRELIAGSDVLRIEYYPTRLFTEGRASRDRRPHDREEDFVDRMNKVSVVTLWIAQDEHQILRSEFENVDLDSLPGRALVRIDGMRASMRHVVDECGLNPQTRPIARTTAGIEPPTGSMRRTIARGMGRWCEALPFL